MIELINVNKRYPIETGGTYALRSCSMTIKSGEFVAIIGTSGSGKTTLLNLIGCLDKEYNGEIRIDGHLLDKLSDDACSRLRNETIGFIFQEFQLLDHLSVKENIQLPRFFADNPPTESDEQRVKTLINSLGIESLLDQKPAHLSGGQRQRVAIARALINKPKILLCDEPTGSLDTETGTRLLQLFKTLNAEGYTIVMITHDLAVAERADRIIRIQDGCIHGADNDAL